MHLTRNARFLTVVLPLAVLMLTAGVAQAPASASRPLSSTPAGSAKEPGGGDDIRANEEWFFGQRAYPAKHTPDRALVRRPAKPRRCANRRDPAPPWPRASTGQASGPSRSAGSARRLGGRRPSSARRRSPGG